MEWRPSRERDRERKRVRELRKAMGGRRRRTGRGSYLLCHLSHGLDAGSIQVAIVLAGLDELVGLNVLLHFLPGRHKVVIPAIYLVFPLGPRRMGNTGSELVGELGEEIIVGAVLGGPEDNDGASIVH